MPRVVVYDEPAVQAELSELIASDPEVSRAPAPRRRRRLRQQAEAMAAADSEKAAEKAAAGKTPTKDDYLEKLAKYVPAEIITVTTLVFGAFKPNGNTVWVYVACGSLANVLYLFTTALAAPAKRTRPRWYFYVLAVGAFWLWAIAVIDAVQKKAKISGDDVTIKQAAILAVAAFLIPLVDEALGHVKFHKRR